MLRVDTNRILAEIQALLEKEDINSAIQLLEEMRSPDQAEVFFELNEDDQISLLPHLDPATSADILEELEDEDAAQLVTELDSASAIRIVDEMDPDEAADLLNEFPFDQAETILAGLDNKEEIRSLLAYPEDTAGGLMTSEYVALRQKMTSTQAIDYLRQLKPDSEEIYYLFVVDQSEHLVGIVGLRDLITADPKAMLEAIMDTQVIAVTADTDQEECAQLISKYDLLALPVIDATNRLLGVITVDDVIDVIEAENTEDFQRLGGAEPLDQPYLATGTWRIASKRVGWLMLLFVTGSLTGTVMQIFENELQSIVALAYFIPLLIGTGGNAGSQTTSTIIRALATGDIDFSDGLKSLWHELRVGILLGLGMAVFGYIRAITWGTSTNLALTVALAITTIVIWANAFGAVLPILAARLKIDPTVVSGPVMSTLVDATGLFIYFSIAKLVIGI